MSTPIFKLAGNAAGGVQGYAGLEVIAWETARGLARKGHEVALVAPDGSECPGVTVIPCGPERQTGEKQAFKKYRDSLPGFDVVIDHSWSKFAYLLKAAGGLRAPCLGVLHAPVKTMYDSLPPGVEKPCFVCISKDQAAQFEALFQDWPHQHVQARVCYNGIDLDHYKPITGMRRTDRYLFLARFSTIKGPDLAIRACLEAGVGLDLVGDTSITNEPDYFRECQRLAGKTSPGWDTAARGRQINVVGGVSRGETVYWYSRAHAFLHPNLRFKEPLGLGPLEAQACGLPVCAFDYGAMRETVGVGCGMLVKTEQEFIEVVRRYKVTDQAREKARAWALNWSVDRMVGRYLELCEEAVATGGW